MPLNDAVLFFLAVFAATISPGPNILILLIYSIRYGWKNALFTITGNLTSLFLQTSIAAFSFGAIITLFEANLKYFKVAGAVYLFYMGARIIYQTIRNQDPLKLDESGSSNETAPRFKMAKDAFLISITNPKALLFQAAIFPQFLRSENSVLPQFIVMFSIILLTVAVIHVGYALFAARIFRHLRSSRTRRTISFASGCWFIFFGFAMIVL